MYDEAHEEEIHEPPEPVDLAFESLTYRLASGRAVLRNVSGHFGHGQMSAILGPSGAGKTTLLLLLAGKIRQTSGVVRVNGRAAHMRRFRSLLGYVPEEDIMIPELTVEETLRFAVRLKLPTALSATERAAEVEHVMRLLGLLHVRHTRIGDVTRRGVSFGERRRVNIAIELVGRPSVLFVDDATAGLDSTTALQVMTTLRRLAESGVNLVTVIHQPSELLFAMFDRVLLMSGAGGPAYQGVASLALRHFEATFGLRCGRFTNPADYLLELVSEPPSASAAVLGGGRRGGAEAAEGEGEGEAAEGGSDEESDEEAGEADTLLAAGRWRGHADDNQEVASFLRRRRRGAALGGGAAGGGAAGSVALGVSSGHEDDAALLQRAALFEPVKLVSAWDAQPTDAATGAPARPTPPHLPAARPGPSGVRLLLLFVGRSWVQLWRGRWTLLCMLLAAAGAAGVTGLTHSRHEFIGPLPFG